MEGNTVTIIVTSVLSVVGTFVASYFAFREKNVGYNKTECEKLKVRVADIEKQNRQLVTNEKLYKAGLKMLLQMKKTEANSNPDDVMMIEQIIKNIDNINFEN